MSKATTHLRIQGPSVVLMPTDSTERLKRTRPTAPPSSASAKSTDAKKIVDVPFVRFHDAEECLKTSAAILLTYFTRRGNRNPEEVFQLQSELALAARSCKWAVETLIGGDIEEFD